MKSLWVAVFMLVVALAAHAEQPSQWAGAGAFFNQDNSPQISGMLAYAKQVASLAGRPSYSFTRVNITSITRADWSQPVWVMNYRVMTSVETGLAQYLTTFGKFQVYTFATAGPAFAGEDTGTSVGTMLGTGAFAFAGIKRGWTIGPVLSISKPFISEANNPGAGRVQWAVGMVIGWGE